MDYPPNNRQPPPMHHQLPPHPMHHPQHPLLSNQLQPINPETHTSMWLDDPYAVSNASQRDSGFNSRPASLRSIESTVTSTTGPLHHGSAPPAGYEQIAPPPPHDHENIHPQYTEMQPAPVPPPRLDPNQVIPELLNLLMEEDSVIVREAVVLTHTLIKEGGDGRIEVIRNRELILALLDSFSKDVGDGKMIFALATLFHALSQQPEGLRAILECGGIPRLIQFLDFSAPDNTVNFIVTTLHNFLINLQDQSANEIDRCNGTQNLMNLLNSANDKLLTLVSDCLLRMSIYNINAKYFIQNNEECVQRLLHIFDTTKYDKLLLTISKLFPIISSGSETIKRIFLQLNALSIFEKQIRVTKSIRIRHNCLIALRNISDQATRMRDVDSLIQQLVAILVTDDNQSVLCSLGILSNLTADNRGNKSLLVKLNGVQTLMQKLIMNADRHDDLIEAALCTLRHVTARHDLENEAREAIKKSYGIGNIVKLLRDKNFMERLGTIKATVGLIKNLALSPTIISQLCEQNAVGSLIELLKNIDQKRLKSYDENKQVDAMSEIIVGALINLVKDLSCKSIIIKEMSLVSILIRYSHLPSCSLQQASSTLLKELNIDRDRNQINDSASNQQFHMTDSRHIRQQ